ncbi:hypothetical protein [uncultured Nitrospira sp.]|uniref:hypothetical protein n=1 Tax=uncultured Nitrospira sp. TaxID=157176 RepID=UPI00313FFC92
MESVQIVTILIIEVPHPIPAVSALPAAGSLEIGRHKVQSDPAHSRQNYIDAQGIRKMSFQPL